MINLFPLKVLVITLGILLLSGMIFMFCILVQAGHKLHEVRCTQNTSIHLKDNGLITNVTVQGNTIHITQTTIALPLKTQLIIADRCSGALLQTINIDHD
jgi:hypothetical protein